MSVEENFECELKSNFTFHSSYSNFSLFIQPHTHAYIGYYCTFSKCSRNDIYKANSYCHFKKMRIIPEDVVYDFQRDFMRHSLNYKKQHHQRNCSRERKNRQRALLFIRIWLHSVKNNNKRVFKREKPSYYSPIRLSLSWTPLKTMMIMKVWGKNISSWYSSLHSPFARIKKNNDDGWLSKRINIAIILTVPFIFVFPWIKSDDAKSD